MFLIIVIFRREKVGVIQKHNGSYSTHTEYNVSKAAENDLKLTITKNSPPLAAYPEFFTGVVQLNRSQCYKFRKCFRHVEEHLDTLNDQVLVIATMFRAISQCMKQF